jgi:small multidrug resistance pump
MQLNAFELKNTRFLWQPPRYRPSPPGFSGWTVRGNKMTRLALFYLCISILMEVVATTSLKLSDSFSRLVPSVVAIAGYAIAFYCLTVPMKTIPTGIIYAIWSGAGIVLIAFSGWIFSGQKLDIPALTGIGLILCGVIVINLFSKSVMH